MTSVKSIIHNTVIAGNTATGGSADVFGSFTSQGFNLIGDGTGSNGFTNFVNGDLVGTTALPIDAKLGALQDNGGFTFTMAPLAGSPVIDRGDPINFPITDQRGILRPSGARPDIGAVESVKSLQVDSLADVNNGDYSPGNITLREAILAVGDRGSITFDPLLNGQTLSLTLGPLEINKLLTITGLGANRLTISGNQQSAVFAIANQAQVTIAGLTIANGFSHTDGGGILNHGTLTLINDALSNNHARNGGGIFNDGRLTLMNDTLSGNTATLNGGGLANLGTSTVTHSTLSGNVANGNGGGIWNTGNLSLLSDTVAVNNASRGGGISNTGTTQIKNALIAKNTATQGIDLLGHFTSQGFNLILTIR